MTFLEEYLEFVDNLKQGIFIQYTTESVLQVSQAQLVAIPFIIFLSSVLFYTLRISSVHNKRNNLVAITITPHTPSYQIRTCTGSS